MSTSNGPVPVQPWTCPHCSATWHSGRQYCVDCGYGIPVPAERPWPAEVLDEAEMSGRFPAPGGASSVANTPEQTALLEGLAGMPRKTAEEIEAGQRERLSGQVEGRDEVLRRSLEAESALQAEVQLLRERVGQLTQELGEQRRTLVEGVQQLLAPLRALVERAGRGAVPVGELCTHVAVWVQALQETVAQVQAEAKTLRRPVEVRRVAPEAREMQVLAQAVGALDARLSRLEASRPPAMEDPGSETYDTFVMSDRQSAEIERAILEAQTRHQRPFPG